MQRTRVVLPTLINASTSSLKMLRIIYTSLIITTYNCTYIRYTISVIATRTTKAAIRMKTARLSQTCCQIHTKYTLEHVYTWFECVFMSYNHLESISYHYKPAHARPNIGDREHVPRSYNPHIKWYDTHINGFMTSPYIVAVYIWKILSNYIQYTCTGMQLKDLMASPEFTHELPNFKWVQPTVHRAIRAKHKRIRVLLSLYHS